MSFTVGTREGIGVRPRAAYPIVDFSDTYTEGTLAIDIFDAKTKRPCGAAFPTGRDASNALRCACNMVAASDELNGNGL